MSYVTISCEVADGINYGHRGAGAVYSEDTKYRFRLWRIWDRTKPIVLFDMLNPSTATHLLLDATLRRAKQFAIDWGFGGFEVVNLFAWRATEPEDMKAAAEPIGFENDELVLARSKEIIRAGGIVVAGWGTHGTFMNRCHDVRSMLRRNDVKLHYIKLTAKGHPSHPLYLKAELKPQEWV